MATVWRGARNSGSEVSALLGLEPGYIFCVTHTFPGTMTATALAEPGATFGVKCIVSASGGVCGLAGGHCLVSGYVPLALSAAALQRAAVIL